MTVANADQNIDFPDDVGNALKLLRYCLDVLRIEVGQEYDEDLRSIIDAFLERTKFRVATDEQLHFEYDHVGQMAFDLNKLFGEMVDKVAANVSIRRKPDGDDLRVDDDLWPLDPEETPTDGRK